MRFNFYHSTCNAVLALVSLFAFGFSYGQSKTVQSGYQVISVGDTEIIALSEGTYLSVLMNCLRLRNREVKPQDSFVWIPVPCSMLGCNQ